MNKVALLFSVTVAALGAVSAAQAQNAGTNALDTYRMVVEARNAAQACGFVSGDEVEELKHYSALSEIAAARTAPVETIQSVRSAAEARRPSCDSRDQQQVQYVLQASRQAVAGGGKGKGKGTAPVVATVEPAPHTQQLEPVTRSGFAAGSAAAPLPPAQAVAAPLPRFDARDPFQRYGAQVRGYFLERKCNFLDYDTELDFWKRLTARYKAMVAEYGRKRVNAAQIDGEKSAENIPCGRQTRQYVNEVYRDLVSVSRL